MPNSSRAAICKLVFSFVITLALLFFCFYVLLWDKESPEDLRKLAVGLLGAVAGYWVK